MAKKRHCYSNFIYNSFCNLSCLFFNFLKKAKKRKQLIILITVNTIILFIGGAESEDITSLRVIKCPIKLEVRRYFKNAVFLCRKDREKVINIFATRSKNQTLCFFFQS